MMGIQGFLIFCFVIGPCFMGRLAQFDHRFRTSPADAAKKSENLWGPVNELRNENPANAGHLKCSYLKF